MIFEKIRERLQKVCEQTYYNSVNGNRDEGIRNNAYHNAINIINQVEAEYNNGWISVDDELPPVETEVLIVAKRKWRNGTCRYITTTAMYEDGTVLENNSCWRWEDIEGEWNEEEDCYIIPEGWWEHKHYNGDCELNHEVDDKVLAWQPLPEPYTPKGE